jgi:hypothetical protein
MLLIDAEGATLDKKPVLIRIHNYSLFVLWRKIFWVSKRFIFYILGTTMKALYYFCKKCFL